VHWVAIARNRTESTSQRRSGSGSIMGKVVLTRSVRFHVLALSLNSSLPQGGVRSHRVNPLAVQEGLSCRDDALIPATSYQLADRQGYLFRDLLQVGSTTSHAGCYAGRA